MVMYVMGEDGGDGVRATFEATIEGGEEVFSSVGVGECAHALIEGKGIEVASFFRFLHGEIKATGLLEGGNMA